MKGSGVTEGSTAEEFLEEMSEGDESYEQIKMRALWRALSEDVGETALE